jgi:hypothetical protein
MSLFAHIKLSTIKPLSRKILAEGFWSDGHREGLKYTANRHQIMSPFEKE